MCIGGAVRLMKLTDGFLNAQALQMCSGEFCVCEVLDVSAREPFLTHMATTQDGLI